MAIDLTGGMDPSKDHFLAERPEDPDFRESASFWVFDDRGEIGLPRIGIEAVASEWDKRGLQLNLGFADGRALIVRGLGEEVVLRRVHPAGQVDRHASSRVRCNGRESAAEGAPRPAP